MTLYGTSSVVDPSSVSTTPTSTSVIIASDTDDNDPHQRLLGGSPPPTMTLMEVLYAYDLTLAQLAFQKCGRNLMARVAWEVFSHTGDGILWFLMVLPIVVVMYGMGMLHDTADTTKTVFIAFYTCCIVDLVAIVILKLIFKRARPPHHHNDGRFVGPDQHSFPSGHATRSWCIVGFVLDLAHRHPSTARTFFHMSPDLLGVLIVLWALTIGFSRVALGRHYPSDVLAGALIGFFILYPISLFSIRHFTSLTDF